MRLPRGGCAAGRRWVGRWPSLSLYRSGCPRLGELHQGVEHSRLHEPGQARPGFPLPPPFQLALQPQPSTLGAASPAGWLAHHTRAQLHVRVHLDRIRTRRRVHSPVPAQMQSPGERRLMRRIFCYQTLLCVNLPRYLNPEIPASSPPALL